jgi:hypothetical protein
VPGLGKKTVELLYRKFKSLSQIKPGNRDEIEAEIGKKRTGILFDFLFSGLEEG